MICSKEFSLTVQAGPPPPAVLFDWDVPTLIPSATGTATFTPNNTTGNTAIGSITVPDIGDAGHVDNVANYSLTSNAVIPCNMHIEVSSAGLPSPPVDPFIGWGISVDTTATGNLFLVSGLTDGYNTIFDVPFNLPNTGGIPDNVEWTVAMDVGTFFTGGASLNITAVFTVL